jgi:hypothetical protein
MRYVLSILLATILASCGGSEIDRANEVLPIAQKMVRERLKVPGSARFVALSDTVTPIISGDTLTLASDSVKVFFNKDTAIVAGYYEAQNTFGVYLPGSYRVYLRKDSTETWVGMTGVESIDISID